MIQTYFSLFGLIPLQASACRVDLNRRAELVAKVVITLILPGAERGAGHWRSILNDGGGTRKGLNFPTQGGIINSCLDR